MIESSPSRTALRVAMRRAAHQVVDDKPLVFPDPFAVAILGPEDRAELGRTPNGRRKPFSSGLRAWMVARARYAEDVLAKAAHGAGMVQYVVLGAGLDTFALRNPFPNVKVFEVDHPATQAWKQRRLLEAGLTLPETATLVPVDFERDSLLTSLQQHGFDPARQTVSAWLGVVPYLSAEAFASTCRVLATFAPGSTVVFDYGQPRSALPAVEQLMHDSLASRVAEAGEPFQLFFTPPQLREQLAAFGLAVVEDLGGRDLNGRYFAGRTDGLQLRGSGGRLCRATVP